jgi:primosomal protein N' (replication factor Y)
MATMNTPGVRVAHVALPVPLPQAFDYLPAQDAALPPVGSRVLVPFGRRRLVGVVLGHGATTAPLEKLKAIAQVLDEALLGEDVLALHAWASRYYAYPAGEAVELLLPPALRRAKPFRSATPKAYRLTASGQQADAGRAHAQKHALECLKSGVVSRVALIDQGVQPATVKALLDKGWIEQTDHQPVMDATPGPTLNTDQRATVETISGSFGGFAVHLLAGITGSGKTEVYLQLAKRVLDTAGQVLIMAPEIGLSPQLIRRVEARLGVRAFVYHSELSASERLACWQACRSGQASVVIGTRSAVFLPFQSLGLLVVDEEHDASFKQIDGARYHGRDLAVWRAKHLDIPIVLGSATPSLESLNNVFEGRYQQHTLAQRAGDALAPRWRIIDQRGEQEGLSDDLLAKIDVHLSRGQQVLLYRNRRGFAPVMMCQACGWQADCHRCSAHMTLHQSQSRLQCHHCGHQTPTPRRCPSCQDPNLIALGAGTERLEAVLGERFPNHPVHRVDRDVMTGRHDFETLLAEVKTGGPCILVGTQMLAKGHHLPKVTLAAVLDVDQALFSGDFRAPERLGQVVFQVAGRAGRVVSPDQPRAEFVLQTRHPEHTLLARLLEGDYIGFAQDLLAERRQAGLPPAEALVLLRAEAHHSEAAVAFLNQASQVLAQAGLEVQGPIPAIMAKRGGYWRHQLWLQAPTRARLIDTVAQHWVALYDLPTSKKVRWHVDVDPTEL